MKYHVCGGCAYGLTYDDWTHLDNDMGEEGHEEHCASIDATVEAIGRVHQTGTENVGCFTCFICDEVSYGDAHVFEGEDS